MSTTQPERIKIEIDFDAEPIGSVLGALSHIKDLQITDFENSSISDEFFLDLDLGTVMAFIIDTCGETSISPPGCKQLRGTDGQERFLATYHPKRQFGEQFSAETVHIVITPDVPFNEQLYSIPITIPLETGRPRVQHNAKPSPMRNTIIGEPMAPAQAFEQIQHLADIMLGSLQNPSP